MNTPANRRFDGDLGRSLMRLTALLTLFLVFGAHSAPAIAQPLMQANISVAQARQIVDAVIAECSRPGDLVTVTVAVVDRAGRPVMQVRADTATTFNWELAYRKAYTALSV
jgi:hypothetical protein